MSDQMSYTIVGVVGHIDHGKTSLVAALTGVDTDTHPEEKQRGITIDLGFASFAEGDQQFALIDAPGHQRYMSNLLAGVSGIDIGLLVVACDQGIQAQTLEHASILQILGVTRLVVVLSRADLADKKTQVELREELEVFLDDFGFTNVPMITTSLVTNTGIDDLKLRLCEFARNVETRRVGKYFRMPVDRAFTLPGRGCVIAGTVWSGTVNVGDSLFLTGSERTVRVREVEVHGQPATASTAGYRTALNITGVSASDVKRGDELIHSAYLRSKHLLVELRTLPGTPEIKCPATLQLHIGAGACSARVTGARRLKPSQSVVVVVETRTPVVASIGQKCLFRLPYPAGTVGGATVLATIGDELTRTRKLVELGETLALCGMDERLVAWTEFLREVDATEAWCELQLDIPVAEREAVIEAAVASGKVEKLSGGTYLISLQSVDNIQRFILKLLAKQTKESTDAWVVEESVVQQAKGFGTPKVIRRSLLSLVDDGRIVRLGNRIAIASDDNALSKNQIARMEKIVALFENNRSPPSTKVIAETLHLPEASVTSLSRFGVQAGILLDCGSGLLLSFQTFQTLCQELQELFDQNPQQTVAEIRDHWQVTRKHAIPFLELCDVKNITQRNGDVRIAGAELKPFAAT